MGNKERPASFLNGIERIVFDMDGVITSEQNYWNAATLTVYEMLNSSGYFGEKIIKLDLSEQEIYRIRNKVFFDDKLISLLKDRGINTNWDLAFVVVALSIIILSEQKDIAISESSFLGLKIISPDKLDKSHYEYIYRYILDKPIEGYEIYDFIARKLSSVTGMGELSFKRQGELWCICQSVFQEWYLGDNAYLETYGDEPRASGKNGLIYFEQPIIPLDELKEIISLLYSSGVILGIGTGRPFIEIDRPLEIWDIKRYFCQNAYITYDDVMKGEKRLRDSDNGISLAKPHPYVFLKAIYGKDYPDELLFDKEYDLSLIKKTLVIGDAGSDIMAAKAIGCKFVAVLTGVSGNMARPYFEEMGADYILDSIRDLVD